MIIIINNLKATNLNRAKLAITSIWRDANRPAGWSKLCGLFQKVYRFKVLYGLHYMWIVLRLKR